MHSVFQRSQSWVLSMGLCALCVVLSSIVSKNAYADANHELGRLIVGSWKFTGMLYQGNWMPPRDERLDLRYEFQSNGESRLAWSYDQWQSLCERRGIYFVETFNENGIEKYRLIDRTLWVNPNNRDDCSTDPDMQMDKENRSVVRMVDSKFEVDLPLGNETLTYQWDRIEILKASSP